jgi:hypothetical protein
MRRSAPFSLASTALFLLGVFAGCSAPTTQESSSVAPSEPPVYDYSFNFTLAADTLVSIPARQAGGDWYLDNGGEVIVLTNTSDSTWSTAVFDGEVHILPRGEGLWVGYWEDQMRSALYRIPLEVFKCDSTVASRPVEASSWEVTFNQDGEPYGGTLIVHASEKEGGSLRATVMTPTGDYRFLHGTVEVRKDGREIWTLQTFDGAHLFWLQGERLAGRFVGGVFKSGSHYRVNWEADQLSDAIGAGRSTLPDLDDGIIAVHGLNEEGSLVSWTQGEGAADVTILEITGTWCPNCMDAGRALLALKRERPELEVLSLCFERLGDPAQALGRINRFKSGIGATWPHLWAGPASKQAAADSLPFLQNVLSFPTTVFVPRAGEVVIHSGFNGPATGVHYKAQQARFGAIIDSLAATL